ncbi:hypothetical protein B0H13DRAFT_2380163 [Mycena leptocephala]|nr:hypothetical protein B0H13DRAFT_2380163 [Mycena leptocephala]
MSSFFVVLGGSRLRRLRFFKPASFLVKGSSSKASARDSSGSSTLSSKVIKVEKRPVDAMDVDEPAAPPKKVNRSAKGVSAVSNAAESSSQARERPVLVPKTQVLALTRSAPQSSTRVVDLESITIERTSGLTSRSSLRSTARALPGTSGCIRSTSDAEEIGKTYKAVEARDPTGSGRPWRFLRRRGSRSPARGTGSFLWRDRGRPCRIFNAVCLIDAAVQYRYGILEPMDPLPSIPTIPSSLTQETLSRAGDNTPATFPSFDGQRYSRWGVTTRRGRVYGAQRSKFSEWRKRAKEYRDKIPGLHQHQSERVLSYIKEREGILREIQTRKNTLAVISCIASAPNSKKKTAPSRAASPPGRPERRERPLSEEAAPPPPPPSIPRKRGKAMSDEPEIAVLERGSISGSDDVPLSVLQSAKGKGKSKMDAAPAPRRRRSPPSLMTASRSAGSAGEGRRTRGRRVGDRHEEGEGEEGEAAGERGDDGAAEHLRQRGVAPGQRPFRLRRALDSTGGNKSSPTRIPTTRSTRAFQDLEAQVTLASLPCRFLHAARGAYGVRSRSPMRSLALRGRRADGGVHALPRDNVTCEASPVEFDWEVTDGALPDINAEFLELQLTLMLEIAEQVGDWDDERLLARFMHHLRIMGTDEDVSRLGARSSGAEEGDDRTDDSETEVEWTNEGLLSRRAQRLGRVVSHARSSDSFEDGRVEVPSGPRSFSSASRPSALVSLLVTGPTSTPRKSVPTPLQTPRSPPAVAASSSLSLSTSIFGKAGSLLSTKPNETSEGGAGGGDSWRGELDAEGESSSGIPRVRRRAQGRT